MKVKLGEHCVMCNPSEGTVQRSREIVVAPGSSRLPPLESKKCGQGHNDSHVLKNTQRGKAWPGRATVVLKAVFLIGCMRPEVAPRHERIPERTGVTGLCTQTMVQSSSSKRRVWWYVPAVPLQRSWRQEGTLSLLLPDQPGDFI